MHKHHELYLAFAATAFLAAALLIARLCQRRTTLSAKQAYVEWQREAHAEALAMDDRSLRSYAGRGDLPEHYRRFYMDELQRRFDERREAREKIGTLLTAIGSLVAAVSCLFAGVSAWADSQQIPPADGTERAINATESPGVPFEE